MAYQDLRFDILYALAAKDSRDKALFGNSYPAAREAFAHSQPTDALPELWFELPLKGEPWFDLHALTSREGLQPNTEFVPERTGGYPEVFRWFASQQRGVRQLALSWDTGSDDARRPAIQLLASESDPRIACGFLEAAGKSDACGAYRTFVESMPEGWFACYTGVFPTRKEHFLRVECIPVGNLQHEYAHDRGLLERHLTQIGLADEVPSIARFCHQMANTPFKLEFQCNVDDNGRAIPTFAASLRFDCPPGQDDWLYFGHNEATEELMQGVQDAGLADDRWRLLQDLAFASRATRNGQSRLIYCFPAFIKIRWHAGELLDAKTYLMAGEQC